MAGAFPGNLLPSGVGFHAARADQDRFSGAVLSLAARGFNVRPSEIVCVPKFDGSTRPATDMPVTDQLLYQASVMSLVTQLYPNLVTFTGSEINGDYFEFEEYPLSQRRVRYVLIADAASFYEYVDHDRLAYELVGTTGDSDATESLIALLGATMNGSKGLPQGPAASASLSDIYISPVARSLSRAGYRFSRYTDDFRIVATDWTEARRAQVFLEEAMREIGLTIAPGKLTTPKIATYRAGVRRMNETREITPSLTRGAFVGGYGWEPIDQVPVSDEEVAAAVIALRDLSAQKRIDAVATRRMRWAVARLAYGLLYSSN